MSGLLIRGGTCVNPEGSFEADLLVAQGQIVAIGQELNTPLATVIDARGRLVLPGGIDVHVHLPWPTGSFVSTDDFSSGTMAAACGGVTTILDFAIPEDGENLAGALERKLAAAQEQAWVDYGLHLNIRGEVGDKIAQIPEMVQRGFPSFKVFMAYEGFRVADPDLLQVMKAIAQAGGLLSVHAENGPLADCLTQELVSRGETALADYPRARPPVCEVEAIHRVLSYARTLGTRLHVHHVSTAQGAALIALARAEGFPVSGETCPHYLLLSDDEYAGDPTRAAHVVCAPPLRTAQDRAALWSALVHGSLSMVATDHCPYSRAQKEAAANDFTAVPGGMAGVETRLPLLFTEGVVHGRLSLGRLVDIWSTQPARVFGLHPRKGRIAIGSDADLVILDPQRKGTLQAADLHMNSDCLPYEGHQVQGLPLTTILRGEVIVEDGQAVAKEPGGKLVRRYLQRASPR